MQTDAPRRQLCARLCDVVPDGTSSRITWGILNLTLDDNLDAPVTPLPAVRALPGQTSYEVTQHAPLRRKAPHMADGAPITGWHQPWTARHYHATGTTFGFESRAAFRIDPEGCLSAACRFNHEMAYERPDGTARVACGVEVIPDAGNYHVTARCTATWDEEIIAVREWNFSTARKLS